MPLTREITPETQHLLERIYRHSRHHQVRQRAHCLLLRSQGIKNVALRGSNCKFKNLTIFKVNQEDVLVMTGASAWKQDDSVSRYCWITSIV